MTTHGATVARPGARAQARKVAPCLSLRLCHTCGGPFHAYASAKDSTCPGCRQADAVQREWEAAQALPPARPYDYGNGAFLREGYLADWIRDRSHYCRTHRCWHTASEVDTRHQRAPCILDTETGLPLQHWLARAADYLNLNPRSTDS